MSKIVVLDNYDSFTFNLVHYIEDITGNNVDDAKRDMAVAQRWLKQNP